jgi:RHH-type transcriptional regulator, proline utilization regulon repressor / proline dehydrogenase / delta 1-pyrroline-5-carboxylate dehydrogenase
VQADIADRLLAMLAGAMAELKIGDPALIATDIGPVIDAAEQEALEHHAARMARAARLIHRCALPPGTEHGTYFAPQAWEIDSAAQLDREVFGPILHVVRWQANRLDAVLDEIAASGYGLTLGIHSRIDETVRHILDRRRVGNTYVNRSMIGAVVGVQPFGGEGLSGTGPKAGGPRYLHRFATERTVSTDTTAAGGNATLLSMQDEL